VNLQVITRLAIPLDRGVDPEADPSNRAGDDAGDDADRRANQRARRCCGDGRGANEGGLIPGSVVVAMLVITARPSAEPTW
jgi:hypothetical protein